MTPTLPGRWVAFWIDAVPARHVVAVQPGPDVVDALTRGAARRKSRLTILESPDELASIAFLGTRAAVSPSTPAPSSPAPVPPTTSPPSPSSPTPTAPTPESTAPIEAAGGGEGRAARRQRGDLLYLGPGVRIDDPPPGVLIVAEDAAAIPSGPEHPDTIVVPIPLGRAPGGGLPALAIAGTVVPAATRATLDAIVEHHRHVLPTAPVAPAVGALLFMLACARRSRHALDLGTSAGAAALWLASAAAIQQGRVTTVERDAARATLAEKNFRRAGLESRIALRIGAVTRMAPKLGGPFDLVFMDEAAEDRVDDLAAILPACAPGALIVSHGAGAAPADLAGFNARLQLAPRVVTTQSLPLGDGVMLAVLVSK